MKRESSVQKLERAIERSRAVLMQSILPNGRFAAGCEGRALETALALHLFRVLGEHHEVQERMEYYCRRFVARAASAPYSHAGHLDRLLSLVTVKSVLGERCSHQELAFLEATLGAFAHPTQWRKAALLHVLMAELGMVPLPDQVLPKERARSAMNHRWISLILTGVRILQATQLRALEQIDDDDLEFLAAWQSDNGGWEEHVFGTLIILLALARLGRKPEVLARGVAFVLGNIRDDGGVPFISSEDTWVTCMAGLVLVESGEPKDRLAPMAAYLQGQQLPDGGWAYAEDVVQGDTDDTSVCMMFLARQDRARYRFTVGKAARYLASLQNPDGGFPTFVRGAASEVEITAKSLRALGELGRSQEGAVRRAWSWLLANQQEDGGFRTEWNLCTTFPVLHVLAAVATCGHLGGPDIHVVRRRCVEYLLRHRRPNGGWAMHPDDTETHALSTAYAVAGLCYAGYVIPARELERSVARILASQRGDASFHAPPDSSGPRPFIYDVPALATVYSLWALTRVRCAMLAAGMRRGAAESMAWLEPALPSAAMAS